MRITDYKCKRIGYFSQVHGDSENAKPVFRRMNIEELKKINGSDGYEKTPFNCNIYVEDLGGMSAAKPLEDFLIARDSLRKKKREFNVICRSSVLTMIYMAPRNAAKIFSFLHTEPQTIIIEEAKGIKSGKTDSNSRRQPLKDNGRYQSSHMKKEFEKKGDRPKYFTGSSDIRKTSQPANNSIPHINAGCYADIHLTMLPNEEVGQDKKFGESNLYIVVRHRYRYEDGTVVNLFVSKEIDAVEFNEEGDERVSIDLKVGNFYRFVNAEGFEFNSRKAMLMNFLANGICYIHGIMLGDNVVHKIVVMDSLDAVCNTTYLEHFMQKIIDFLFTLATVEDRYMYNRIEIRDQDVVLTNFDHSVNEVWLDQILSTGGRGPLMNETEYDPNAAHHLVIVGSYSEPVPQQNPLYHTDVVSIDNFCKRLFDSFMCEPQSIFVYGKKEEFQKVRRAMTDAELMIAKFVEVE